MTTQNEYAQTQETTEVHNNSAAVEIEKEWRWVEKLPGYGGEYSQKIVDMAETYQHAINLETEARRITTGLEPGADGTLEITAQDHSQSAQLRAQAYDLRLQSVNQAKELFVSINDRWKPQNINLARGIKPLEKTPQAPAITRDLNFERER